MTPMPGKTPDNVQTVEVRIGRDSVRIFHNAAEVGGKSDFTDVAYEDNSASNACYLLGLLARSGAIKLRIKSSIKNEISYTKLRKEGTTR